MSRYEGLSFQDLKARQAELQAQRAALKSELRTVVQALDVAAIEEQARLEFEAMSETEKAAMRKAINEDASSRGGGQGILGRLRGR